MTDLFIPANQRSELVSLALEWMAQGRLLAMVTLVNNAGNSPYPVGTQMLDDDKGRYYGQITGGCAERAIADQAVTAINTKQNYLQRYGLNSPYFDIQLPCGSGIDVFIDVLQPLEGYQEIHNCLVNRRCYTQTLALEDMQFNKHYQPSPRLILAGQGDLLIKTSCMALAAGFDVMCVAQNQDTLDLARDSDLAAVSLDACADLASNCDSYTGVISLFHEHDFEIDILRKAIGSDAFYIGALGSTRTHERRLTALRAQGCNEAELARIYGPVGVNILARTPTQIAVSIIAQAISSLNS